MQIELPYGRGLQKANVIQKTDVLRTQRQELPAISGSELFALLGSSLKELQLGKVVAIAIPDHTRPNITRVILPEIVELLLKNNVHEIRVCVGAGLHRAPTQNELNELIPAEVRTHADVNVVIHDAMDDSKLVFLGYTSFDTPVWIMRSYYEAETKIALSVVEAHQFAGFSGGAKAVAVGLAGEKTISGNHYKLVQPNAQMGRIQNNPVREEIDEIGNMVGIDLLINVVLNADGYPSKIFCGAHPTSHRETCDFLKTFSGVEVEELYDVVIASPGGHPRDIDLYQAQKALPVAEAFCKPGGTIILVAECATGYGEHEYVKLLKEADSPKSLMKNFDFSHFKVGPHKAYLLARTLSRYEVRMVSALSRSELENLFFIPRDNLEKAMEDLPHNARVLAISNTSQVIPVKLQEKKSGVSNDEDDSSGEVGRSRQKD